MEVHDTLDRLLRTRLRVGMFPRMGGGFEDTPATKQDLAGVKEELSGEIGRVEAKVDELKKVVEQGFRSISGLLQEGPPGLVKRVERIEERVGL